MRCDDVFFYYSDDRYIKDNFQHMQSNPPKKQQMNGNTSIKKWTRKKQKAYIKNGISFLMFFFFSFQDYIAYTRSRVYRSIIWIFPHIESVNERRKLLYKVCKREYKIMDKLPYITQVNGNNEPKKIHDKKCLKHRKSNVEILLRIYRTGIESNAKVDEFQF